jgi:hypothetical protein
MHSTSDINRVDCEPLTANQDLLATAEDDCCCSPPPPPATDNDEAEDQLDQESVASDSEGPRFNRDLVPQPPRRCLNAYQEYRKACKCTDKLWKDMTAEERQVSIFT